MLPLPITIAPEDLPDDFWLLIRPNIEQDFSSDVDAHSELLEFCWETMTMLNYDGIKLDSYPPDPQHDGNGTFFIVEHPIIDVNTASYNDNKLMLFVIRDEVMTAYPGMEFILVAGDEQTYDRMVKIKSMEPWSYEWLIPFPGEFHVCGHMLHSTYRLWWTSILQPCSTLLRIEKITMDWRMGEFNRHEEFLLVVTTGLVKWLESIFGADILVDREAMYLMCDDNDFTTRVLEFLYQDALPYFTLRRLLRHAPAPEHREHIDRFFCYLCPRMRSVNKFLYAMLCVHHRFIAQYMDPAYWSVLCRIYTVSLKGRPGRNVPLDHLQEKINKRGKQCMDGVITGTRVAKVIPTLNATHPIETAYGNMMQDLANTRVHMGVRSKEDEIEELCRHMQNHFASTFHQATVLLDYHPLHLRADSFYRNVRTHVRIVASNMVQYVHGHCLRLNW